ncbi:MAG: Rossmann-like and DUF2520 domain-containing protein [Ekhidna sp.]
MSKVAIIGYGNVGYHLANHLQKKHDVTVYVRNSDGIKTFPVEELNPKEFNFIVLATPDSITEEISSSIEASNAIVVHTSGSKPMNSLVNHKRHGVIYPLQTFSRRKEIDFNTFPLFIEGNEEAEKDIYAFASSFSKDVRLMSSINRSKLHLAAVFACNFANHMYHMAEKLLDPINMKFQDLEHLTSETLEKALEMNPSRSQTGPAIRKDESTIQHHLTMMDEGLMKRIYELISEDIRKQSS